MRFLDLLAYISALGVVVLVLFSAGTRDANAPPPPPDAVEDTGVALAPPSRYDEQVLIQAARPQDGVGTAFAVSDEGYWLTARHVVDGCRNVGLFVRTGSYLPAEDVIIDPDHDLALIRTAFAPTPVQLNLENDLRVGIEGFHVGFPQGQPGEAFSRLHSRSNLVTSGRRKNRESVLTWAELGRTRGIGSSLGGISGGPVYDKDGRVRGVVLAESPRRGRIYSASPETIRSFLDAHAIDYSGAPARGFSVRNYGGEADRARRSGQVVKVACRVTR